MIFGDLVGLKLPDICLTGEEKSQKNLTQETCPDRGLNPGLLRNKSACYHLLHSGGQNVQEMQLDWFKQSERYTEKDKDVYAVFVDLEKAFDRVDWKKLMGILKKIGRRVSNIYMKQRIEVRIGEEMSEWREIGRGVWQGCLTLFNIYLDDLMKNCFLNTGGVNIGGRRIKCIRFASRRWKDAEEHADGATWKMWGLWDEDKYK